MSEEQQEKVWVLKITHGGSTEVWLFASKEKAETYFHEYNLLMKFLPRINYLRGYKYLLPKDMEISRIERYFSWDGAHWSLKPERESLNELDLVKISNEITRMEFIPAKWIYEISEMEVK